MAHRVNGRAKVMIVTRSRLHAIRYHRALERYVTEQGYDYGGLVAFSGTVRDGDMDYTVDRLRDAVSTESWMSAPGKDGFERPSNRLLERATRRLDPQRRDAPSFNWKKVPPR